MDDTHNSSLVGSALSAQQRSRISQNYKAAKAILDRKRRRQSDHLSLKYALSVIYLFISNFCVFNLFDFVFIMLV